ncbi:hypothetical protein BDY17DRAFT_300442 [Neohortaea acidophila]|uniref:Uncharacterized protein n=1 Tax=Neohortaea acidophila TaxID=245834 RepID=A0A6A6PRS3_9PEZI|nr:uncharacterized protein BDY17DRAFT_300442 [Neohortaea acidophila]KAF2482173.1 hypothetical protein BDY17DRAFT_300442 [Neohortaea acidophila]
MHASLAHLARLLPPPLHPSTSTSANMSGIARRTATQALRAPRAPAQHLRRSYASAAENKEGSDAMRKAAKRDPELYTLFAIMTGAFTLAGWHFSRNPTSSSSEQKVSMAEGSEPWNTGASGKYQYHPGGDKSRRRDAPSALNEVVIPNVNLPKSLHEKYNKYGKEGY